MPPKPQWFQRLPEIIEEVSALTAARDAGVSMWEMMDYARARKVPAQYDIEDLERDLGTIHGSLGVSKAEQKGATGAE